jgi:hypothetical protein
MQPVLAIHAKQTAERRNDSAFPLMLKQCVNVSFKPVKDYRLNHTEQSAALLDKAFLKGLNDSSQKKSSRIFHAVNRTTA